MSTPHRPVRELLLVDDDDVSRERLARALREREIAVTEAADYAAAEVAISAQRFSHALLDLCLPGGRSGLQLLQVLRRRQPRTKVVLLTGYGSIATALDAMRLGATHYLVKPADADEVLAALTRGHGAPSATQPSYRAPSLARAEWEHINRVLSDSGANISEAARRLGIHRRSLQRKLQKYPPPS